MYIAECPEVGTVDRGESIEKAIARPARRFTIVVLKEATRLYLEEFPLAKRLLRYIANIDISYA